MSNWVLRAEDHLLPVYEELHRQLVVSASDKM